MPEGASRERKGSAPRDVRVPAYKDPSSTLRLSGNEDGIPGRPKSSDHDSDDGYSPTEPAMDDDDDDDDALPESPNDDIEQSLDREVLTAEQAATRRLNKSEPANVPVRKNRVSVGVQSEAVNPKKVSSSSKMKSSVKQGDPGSPPGDDDGDDDAGDGDGESPQEPHWSQFDLGHALMQLRSIREGIVRRALRRLHLRWYHANNKRMRNLLEAVGVAPSVLNMIPSIIDTCSVCRNWQRVGPKSAMSARLPTSLNAEIQMDLLFYKDKIVLHCVDTCISWSSVIAIPDRSLHSLLEGYCKCWLQLYGPPTTIIADQEGGWATEQAATWFENQRSQMTLVARDQHCGVIERHNEILRRQLHLIEDESNNEGLVTNFDMILAEAIFAKNALFQIGNPTPYESLFGRTPPLLSMIGEEAGEVASDRDAARIRQVSINAMIQASAEAKARRADSFRTRRPGELLELKEGDLAEFYRKPLNKDLSGWRGPAEVINLTSIKDGIIHVKWQGRVLAVRVQDARRALLFHTFLTGITGPIKVLKAGAESQIGEPLRVGWIRQGSIWAPCRANVDCAEVLAAGLYVAAFRYGTCVNTLPAVAFDDTLILWWSNNQISEWFHCFTPGDRAISVSRITGDANASMIQFLMVSATEVKSLRQVVSDIPYVSGIHEPQMPNMNDRTDEVLRSRGPRPIADGSNDNHANVSSSFPSLSEDQTSNHEPCNSEDVDSDEEPYSFDCMSITKQPECLGTTYVSTCPHVSSSGIDANTIVDPDELDEPPQFEIPAPLSKCMVMPFASHHAFVNPDHRIVSHIR